MSVDYNIGDGDKNHWFLLIMAWCSGIAGGHKVILL